MKKPTERFLRRYGGILVIAALWVAILLYLVIYSFVSVDKTVDEPVSTETMAAESEDVTQTVEVSDIESGTSGEDPTAETLSTPTASDAPTSTEPTDTPEEDTGQTDAESPDVTEPTEDEEPAPQTATVIVDTTNHDTPDLSDLEYPFDTVSFDWDETTLDGWRHYDIPDEYTATGGYLPDAVQVYAYALCKQNDVDYAMVLAMIEVESGYQWDATSSGGAVGYMQIVPRWHLNRVEGIDTAEELTNPYNNLTVAIDLLAELGEKYDTQDKVLTAYHYGESGAYTYYWRRGRTTSWYSEKVLAVAERIESHIAT